MKSIFIYTKRFFWIFLSFFATVLLSGCIDEYRVHYLSEHGKSSSLSSDIVSSESQILDPEILILPDPQVKQDLIREINKAKKRIWIEIYTWTDKDILQAVIRAHKREVEVKIVLEPSVFGTPMINKDAYNTLIANDIPVIYADSERYTFTHAKFFLIDDIYFISTGNLTQSFFTKNRDLIVKAGGNEIISYLTQLFEKDFHHLGTVDLPIAPSNLVISPIDSRSKTISLIKQTKKRIIIYTQTLSDPEILAVLSELQDDKISVSLCTAKNESNSSRSKEQKFRWKEITKPYPHLKLIFIDSDAVFIGSQNLTTNSLDNNRELGIIIRGNSALFLNLMQIYEKDCRE